MSYGENFHSTSKIRKSHKKKVFFKNFLNFFFYFLNSLFTHLPPKNSWDLRPSLIGNIHLLFLYSKTFFFCHFNENFFKYFIIFKFKKSSKDFFFFLRFKESKTSKTENKIFFSNILF